MTAALPQDIDFTPVDCPQYNEYLAHELTQLAGHMNAGDYKFLKLAAIFDKRNAWVGAGIKSCAHWLQWQCGVTLGAARERVRVARCLELLPKINAAFAAGKISFSMVRAMTRVATDATEDFYLTISEYGTASQLEHLVRTHRRVKKLQEKNPEEEQQESRSLTYYIDDDGMWVIKAKIPATEGELVVKALNAIMDAEEVEAAEAAVSPEEYEEASKPRKTFPQKRADALSTMAEHYVASADNGIADLKGSERTQLLLHVDIKTIQKHTCTDPGHCHLDHDNGLHPDTAKRLSCDASLVTVLEDDKGSVLNIGRRSRIVPPSIKRALDIRDGGCQFPGCGCTRYVDAHHLKHWADGGETRLDNLITLCRFHHRQLHQGEFTITPEGDKFIFSNRRGIKILPTFRPQFPDQENVSAEILEIETIRPEISAETCKTKWAGESLDMDIAIGALLGRELVE